MYAQWWFGTVKKHGRAHTRTHFYSLLSKTLKINSRFTDRTVSRIECAHAITTIRREHDKQNRVRWQPHYTDGARYVFRKSEHRMTRNVYRVARESKRTEWAASSNDTVERQNVYF